MKQPKTETINEQSARLLFVDNIRWFVVVLVVLMHLNVTYSNRGLWYYKEPAEIDDLSDLIFGLYGALNQAYFMGLLFLVAGYFTPGSLKKKGIRQFVWDRWLRLGVPTLVYMLLIHPITMMIFHFFDKSLPPNIVSWYVDHIVSFNFLSTSGPLWFTFALLLFSIVYALIRQAIEQSNRSNSSPEPLVVTHKMVWAVIGFTSLFAFLTRIVMPPGVPLFNDLTGNFMQLGFFPSYIVLFIVGTIAYRRDILANLSFKFGRFWLRLGLFLGIPLLFVVFILVGISVDDPEMVVEVMFGGLHWQSALYSAWESFFAVAISIGIVALFREKFNKQGKLSSFLSQNAFGVYAFHAPIVVAITMSVRNVTITPVVAKMYGIAVIILPICFVFSHLLRRIPIIRRFFS